MNVLVFASRKGGSGKSTLAAHLAAYIHKPTRPCLLVDADPQGSLTLWQALRRTGEPPLKAGTRGIADIVKQAKQDGVEWVLFDTDAVKETIDFSRQLRKPYAVVINAAPPRREEQESPLVTQARERLAEMRVPVWGGQITNRANFILALGEGEGAKEFAAESLASAEIARLWSAIDKSVKAIHGHGAAGGAMHKQAA